MRRHRPRPFRSMVSAIAVGGLALVVLGMVAEWGAGAALKFIRDKRPPYVADAGDDMLSKLYDTDQPQRYREVLAEAPHLSDTVYAPFVEYRLAPWRGRHVTIAEDGWRGNGAEPQDLRGEGRKVFVFGGSTTLGAGVPDNETIPAYLDAALKAAGRSDVTVFNFGAPAYTSTQELVALQQLLVSGIKPDVAVFVDGVEDFYSCSVPDRSAWYEQLMQLTRARSRLPVLVELSHRSNLVQLARHLTGDRSVMMREWGSFCDNEADIDRVIRRLDGNRRMIDGMADRLGFKAVFVQQPVPTYSYDNRKRPLPVRDEMLGYHLNSARGYPRLAAKRGAGELFDRNLLWLADLEPEGNAYIDIATYSPRFNKAIAERVAAAIVEGGLLP
ncbi:MAG: SGNH/GDSL hydrolase family protein [Actinomycetota bacterium]